jgi:hypothetical protein
VIRPELEALIQGSLDNALTAEEQARLARWISESPDARERVAQLEQLATLIESLGPAEAPLGMVNEVLAEVSHRARSPRAIPQSTSRGVDVNKKILFGLAAAAAIVLAVITYNSNPPATVGTEATIGAAQRAQTPQIAAKDVKLGDTSAQDVLQTETFDAIVKDETLRTMLQDAELRKKLEDSALRQALQDENIKKALADPGLKKKLEDAALVRSLSDPDLAKKFDDANIRAMLQNKAFADALRDQDFRAMLSRAGYAAALAGPAMQQALRDTGFAAAVKSQAFASRLAAAARVQ